MENSFGIMATRFRLFLRPIAIDVDKIYKVILAYCALYNFLRKMSKKNYITESYVDHEDTHGETVVPGMWRQIGELQNIERYRSSNSSISAKSVRDLFKKYYNTDGSISFQERIIS